MKKILGIVGSYRKNGAVDTLVTATLAAAEKAGAQTSKIYLTEKHIEFCTNCRTCTQAPGPERGKCVQQDDLESILNEYEHSDGVVLGASVNFYNVTAIMRRFMERLIGYAYWPWNGSAPKMRTAVKNKKAVLITASGMPAVMGRVFTGAIRALKLTADSMGAKPIASIFAGLTGKPAPVAVSESVMRKAEAAGRALASES